MQVDVAAEFRPCLLETGLRSQHFETQALAVEARQNLALCDHFAFLDQQLDDHATGSRHGRRVAVRADRGRRGVGRTYVGAVWLRYLDRYRRRRLHGLGVRNTGFANAAARKRCGKRQQYDDRCECFHDPGTVVRPLFV